MLSGSMRACIHTSCQSCIEMLHVEFIFLTPVRSLCFGVCCMCGATAKCCLMLSDGADVK